MKKISNSHFPPRINIRLDRGIWYLYRQLPTWQKSSTHCPNSWRAPDRGIGPYSNTLEKYEKREEWNFGRIILYRGFMLQSMMMPQLPFQLNWTWINYSAFYVICQPSQRCELPTRPILFSHPVVRYCSRLPIDLLSYLQYQIDSIRCDWIAEKNIWTGANNKYIHSYMVQSTYGAAASIPTYILIRTHTSHFDPAGKKRMG